LWYIDHAVALWWGRSGEAPPVQCRGSRAFHHRPTTKRTAMRYTLYDRLPDHNLEPPEEYPDWLDEMEPAEEEAPDELVETR